MDKYRVYFLMVEKWWYRYDVDAENPEEAYKIAENLMETSPGDPDKEIYDCIDGPFMAEVEHGDDSLVCYSVITRAIDNP